LIELIEVAMKRIFSADQLTVRTSFGMLEGRLGEMGEYYRRPVNVCVVNRSDVDLGNVAVVLMFGRVLETMHDLAHPSPLFGDGNPVVRRSKILWRFLSHEVGTLKAGEKHQDRLCAPDVVATRLGVLAVSGTFAGNKLNFENSRSCEAGVSGVDGEIVEHVTRFGVPYNETNGFWREAVSYGCCRFFNETRLGQALGDAKQRLAGALHRPEQAVRSVVASAKQKLSFPY
jgi:hypothetical protein